MRVAIFTETFLPKMDGIVRVICLLADHLIDNGHEVMVIAPRLNDDAPTAYRGQPVVTVGGVPIPWYQELRITPPSRRVYQALQDFKPDVAHFFHPVTIGLPGLLMTKQLGIPSLVSFHLDFARLATYFKYGFISLAFLEKPTNLLTKWVFNWAEYRLAPSKAIQQQMHAMGIEDVGLWKRGVDAERFHPRFKDAAMRARMSNDTPDAPLLLYVGRLSAEKRIQDFRPMLDRLPHVRLALVGDGPYEDELHQIFADTNTVFMGRLGGDELSQAYASADAFVFASELETFGLVVVEAMAAGLPVVASRVGGIPDVVNEGVTGYTFEIGDIDGLVNGVERIIAHPQQRINMGQNARAYAETQTWGHMMDEVIGHYRRMVRAKHLRNVLRRA